MKSKAPSVCFVLVFKICPFFTCLRQIYDLCMVYVKRGQAYSCQNKSASQICFPHKLCSFIY